MTIPSEISASDAISDIPPVWFDVPSTFFALPLAETPEERAERAETFVRQLYSQGDESIWEPAAPYYEALAEHFSDSGLSYSAMGLFSTDEGAVVQCAFTLAAVETGHADPDIAAQGTLATLSVDSDNDARWLDLPCGPAISCVTLTELVLNAGITASGEQEKLLTGQIQVHVPFPNAPYTAVFTMHTASMDYWGEICDMTAAVLDTVSFEEPEVSSRGVAQDGTDTVTT
ncbi:hypothetical protein HUT18_23480 [Streptomyces sp. NA04227]|uniref:hypothetical protein n=1 Tax=Streptomyces sp. NA04227 TaxID=2742136 RepID=UPI00159280EB|nr:hypothetical protein [Streptomyces sp. NA04227]QKW08900.1 hypothetical protein HUT18_23480 [Streptomyces sp. NA04227]